MRFLAPILSLFFPAFFEQKYFSRRAFYSGQIFPSLSLSFSSIIIFFIKAQQQAATSKKGRR
jgi:hypothetical protein